MKTMGSRAYALLTGVFIVLFGGIVALASWWLSGAEIERKNYTVVALADVSGLAEASAVLYRGVPSGRVNGIRFNPEDIREILIDIELDAEIPVTVGTRAFMRPQGVTGLSQLLLSDSGENLQGLETSAAEPGRIPLEPGILDRFTASGDAVLNSLVQLTKNLNAVLDDKNRDNIAGILANIEILTERFETIESDFATALETVPSLADEASQTLADARHLMTAFEDLPAALQTTTNNINALLVVGQRVGNEVVLQLTPAFTSTLAELNATNDELQGLARLLQTHPQSLLQGKPPMTPGPGESGYQERAR
ncbi:MAG: MlaD family protein [Pseudomonadales bacterium]|nr:MlaD family protein [Pseudomonadales bacterium]